MQPILMIDVAAVLTTNPDSNNGVLTVCSGEPIAITCTHVNDASGVTRWEVSGTTSESVSCTTTVAHTPDPNIRCGNSFTITMISGPSGPTFSSTAQAVATEALDGAVVACFDRGIATTPQGNITITVLGEIKL